MKLYPINRATTKYIILCCNRALGRKKPRRERCQKVKTLELLKVEEIIFGSPAFSASANIGGGNETTILDILNGFLIHVMIIQGDTHDDHYGPVAINAPDKRASKQCRRLGQKVARLVKKAC